jgi:nicotinate-nucleotide pyrophosphorylase (carboxylating)
MNEERKKIETIIKNALKEDMSKEGDITTEIFIDKKLKFTAQMIAKEDFILCGVEIAAMAFKILNKKNTIKIFKKDGTKIKKGEAIMEIYGDRSILIAERTALNLIQRLSGIATYTDKLNKILDSRIKILDTRKTTPGLRIIEKYAVKTGKGYNHRFGLYDAFLIKDNHIACLKDLSELKKKINLCRNIYPSKNIEIEAQSLKQVKDFSKLDIDIIMLDNMKIKEIKKAIEIIKRTNPKIKIEVSGGINEKNLKRYSNLKIDYISIGALTHSVKSADISLEIKIRR